MHDCFYLSLFIILFIIFSKYEILLVSLIKKYIMPLNIFLTSLALFSSS